MGVSVGVGVGGCFNSIILWCGLINSHDIKRGKQATHMAWSLHLSRIVCLIVGALNFNFSCFMFSKDTLSTLLNSNHIHS